MCLKKIDRAKVIIFLKCLIFSRNNIFLRVILASRSFFTIGRLLKNNRTLVKQKLSQYISWEIVGKIEK